MAKANRTVKRALDVLQLLKDENKSMTTTQISIALDMPRSSTFDILYTLLQEGYIEYDNKALKTYVLGLKVFEVGVAYLNTDFAPIVRPFLEKIMAESRSTAFLAIENNCQLVYLDKVEAPTAIRTSAVLGSRSEMYCTGLGKALLATYPESKVRRIFNKADVKKHTENTITDFDALMKELEQTRVRGYAIDNMETDREVFCIAAPVFDMTGNAVAAISLAIMYAKLDKSLIDKYSELVTGCALQISKRLGYMEKKLYYRNSG